MIAYDKRLFESARLGLVLLPNFGFEIENRVEYGLIGNHLARLPLVR